MKLNYASMTFLISSIVVGISEAASRKWVEPWANSAALGVVSAYDRYVFRWEKITFDVSRNSTYDHHRILLRVGGQGKFDDLTYSVAHSGMTLFEVDGAWQIALDGQISKIPVSALTRSSAFREYILYSDDYISTWRLNNVPVGTLVALEYRLITDRILDYRRIYLQDRELCTDSMVVHFDVPEGAALQITAHMPPNLAVEVTDTAVFAGILPEWKPGYLCGGYRRSAARVDYELFLSGQTGAPPRTWSEVSTEFVGKWNSLNKSLASSTTVGVSAFSLADYIKAFERNYRYVAIEIGEGRFIPHEPRQVQRLKYGDCKDLSLFVASELGLYGIPVVPVLVRVPASDPFNPGFPCPYQFNHAIVAILDSADTLYYDPTSRGYPLGVLPWADQGAYALWLREGAELSKLPMDTVPYTQEYQLTGRLDRNGRFQGTLSVLFDSRVSRGEATNQGNRELRDYLMNNLLREGLSIEIDTVMDYHRSAIAKLSIANYARQMGGALYWVPYPLHGDFPDSVKSSYQGYFVDPPTKHRTRLRIELPEGFRINELPATVADTLLCGSAFMQLRFTPPWVDADWSHELFENYYPADQKPSLDSLFALVSTIQGVRVKLLPN